MKIAIVEDNELLAIQIKKVLVQEGYEVDLFNTASDFFANFKLDIEILLLDINLPDMDGLEVLKTLKNYSDSVKTIFITAYKDIKYIREAYSLGCEDYIKKPFDIEELLIRIRKIENILRPKLLKKGKYKFDFENFVVTIDKTPITITAKEAKLLQLFILNENKVVSFSYLNDKLWNGEALTNTITVAILRLKKKLKLDNLENIRNIGYIFHTLD